MIDFIAGFLAGEASFTVQTNVSKNRGSAPRYKYPIEEMEVDIYWYRTPDCPACGEPLTYGMVDWDVHDPDGFMSGWLCESEIPARVEEGIR